MADQWVNVESLGSYFQSLSDPRHTRNRKHLLVAIVVSAVCGMVASCGGLTAIHRWTLKKEWPWVKAIGYSVRITQRADGGRGTRCATTS